MKKALCMAGGILIVLLLCIPPAYAIHNETEAYDAGQNLMAHFRSNKEGLPPLYYPDDIGGISITDDNILSVLIIQPTETRKSELKKISGYSSIVKFIECKYSYTELTKLADLLNNTYQAKYSFFVANVNQTQNKVTVEVYEKDLASVHSLLKKYKDKVHIESGSPESVEVDLPQLDPEEIGAVVKVTADVRAGAGAQYEKVGTVKKDSHIKITGFLGNWAQINWQEADAYVRIQSLCIESMKKIALATANVNVRVGAGTKYSKVGALIKGQEITVTGIDGKWMKIEWNDESGYVYAKYLQLNEGTAP